VAEPIELEGIGPPTDCESWCVRTAEEHAGARSCYGPDGVSSYAERNSRVDASHVVLARVDALAWTEMSRAEAASPRDSLTQTLAEMG
jgi:hypothetical protein